MVSLYSKRSLLVLALLVGQLVCLLAGLIWFAQWLERGVNNIVRERELTSSRQIAGQFARTVSLMGDLHLPLSNDAFQRLQRMVEETRLPNGGQLAILDIETGQVIAHPQLRDDPAIEVPYHDLVNAPPAAADGGADPDDWRQMPDGTYVLAAQPLPELNAQMLVLQPEAPLRQLTRDFMSRVYMIGAVVTVVLVAIGGVVSMLIVRGYENRLAAINTGLENLVDRRSRALMRSREGAIFGLARLAESRDGETGEHLERISTYTTLLARQIARDDPSLDENWVNTLSVASSLHDIGKVGIPDAVLHKPGALSDEERAIIQRHPYIGGDTLLEIQRRWGDDPFLVIASEICFGHHERWDGTGYPFGLSGLSIPLPARIVALADVYDALTSRRAYKEPMSHEDARRFIVENAGKQFDPSIVEAFLAVERPFREVAQSAQVDMVHDTRREPAPAPAAV